MFVWTNISTGSDCELKAKIFVTVISDPKEGAAAAAFLGASVFFKSQCRRSQSTDKREEKVCLLEAAFQCGQEIPNIHVMAFLFP